MRSEQHGRISTFAAGWSKRLARYALLAMTIGGAPLAVGEQIVQTNFAGRGVVTLRELDGQVTLQWTSLGSGVREYVVERGVGRTTPDRFHSIGTTLGTNTTFVDQVKKGRFHYRVTATTSTGARMVSSPLTVNVHVIQRTADGVELLYGDDEPPPNLLSTTAQKLSVKLAPVPLVTSDYRIDSLLSGYKWYQTALTYSFHEEANVQPMSEALKQNYRQIFAWLQNTVNLTFTESAAGDIQIWKSSSPSYAYSGYPPYGDIYLSSFYDSTIYQNGFQNSPGSHGYYALIHELGHALGLKHSFEAPALPAAEDRQSYTVMTYTFDSNEPSTFMGYDLLALQYLYGARTWQSSDTTYTFQSRIDRYQVNSSVYYNPSYNQKLCLWDAGGVNALDCSSLPSDGGGYRFDLRDGGWLTRKADYSANTFQRGIALSYGSTVRRIVNSSSSDDIYAGSSATVFTGYSTNRVTGLDTIYSAKSQDTIDLLAYPGDWVTTNRSGSDLQILLGNNGQIVVIGYYAGNTPQILLGAIPPIPPSIVSQPTNVTVYSTRSAQFRVTATGTRLFHQWFSNSVPIGGGTGTSYTTPPTTLNDSDTVFHVTVSNAFGVVTSSVATMIVIPIPIYTVGYDPNGATSGVVPAPQVKTQDVAVVVAGITGNLARTYHTLVGWNTAANGTGTSYAPGVSYTANASAMLYAMWISNTPPAIVVPPVDVAVYVGRPAAFQVAVTGRLPLACQWYSNSVPVSGATGTSYTTLPTTLSDDGTVFQVAVTNAFGACTSDVATLTVKPTPIFRVPATGGTVTNYTLNGTNWTAHIFTDVGTTSITFAVGGCVEYLIIGGGGGGGSRRAGGGGAGGYRCSVQGERSGSNSPAEAVYEVSAGVYSIGVGAGGRGSGGDDTGYTGSNSWFANIIARGGGGGKNSITPQNADGGSGGGGGYLTGGAVPGGSGTAGQGFCGGKLGSGSFDRFAYSNGGGGGGAGGPGTQGKDASTNNPNTYPWGSGGTGLVSSITGAAVMRAGGGGGNKVTWGVATNYGGGVDINGMTNGVANTGGGGSAGWPVSGGSGGSGIVIIRYVTGIGSGVDIVNAAPANVLGGSATLQAVLTGSNGYFDVWAYWGPTDGTNNPLAWSNAAHVGAFTLTTDTTNIAYMAQSGLMAGTNYYTFFATNAAMGFWAAPSTQFTMAAVGAMAPTGVTAVATATNAITLAWSDNANNETGYVVNRSTDSNTWVLVAEVAAGATNLDDTGLAADTLYYYRVAASNGAGLSVYANAAAATLPDLVSTTRTLTVISAQGGATPGTLTVLKNTELSQAVTHSPVSDGATTQYVCTGWTLAGIEPVSGIGTNLSLTLTRNATLTWQWQAQYWLTTATNGNGTVTAMDGWHVSGDRTPFTATAAANWHFTGWTGDTNGCAIAGNTITAAMSQARSLTANFAISLATNGTPYEWLVNYGLTNGTFNAEELGDPDGDGMVSWQEWLAGTDPTNGKSCLVVSAPTDPASVDWKFMVRWQAVAGKIYTLQATTNVLEGFFDVMTNTPATPGENVYTTAVDRGEIRFYRVKVCPVE